MSAVLNTNVASLWASKNLLGAQSKLAGSVERLSSGLRINRARDDAAGLGVANSLTAQINGANQGVRNLNDAISMVQTAEGAIAAASEMGQRILMLATQGANGTLGSTERAAIQSEMQQLLSSINSIGGRTQFSGNPLLSYSATKTESNLYSMQISNTASDKVEMSSSAFKSIGGMTATLGSTAVTTGTTAVLTGDVPDSIIGMTLSLSSAASGGNLTDKGVTVTSITRNAGIATLTFSAAPGAISAGATLAFDGQLTAKNGNALSLWDAVAQDNLDSTTASLATTAFQNVQAAANSYVVALGTQRSVLGAYQNQMEYTLSNITELSSNLSSARSRVIDTDYASETASLTKGQILQQAATAMLAQANQMPNVILTLLK